MGFLGLGSKDIGIDLGTTQITVTLKGKGIILKEPSVVAIDIRTEKIIATGREAREMLGKTPESIKAIRPLKNGVIADFTGAKMLLKNILKKISSKYYISKPRVIVGTPVGITEVEQRALEEGILDTSAKEVFFIEEPLAAAIGSGMHIEEPTGNMIIDLGGGTTEAAIISLGGIVVGNSSRIAGDQFDKDIVEYLKRHENLSIGLSMAEEIKKEIGYAINPLSLDTMEIRGRDLESGLPRNIIINSSEVLEAIQDSLDKIVNIVTGLLEKTPPELAADLVDRGIVLSGGGAALKNLDQLLAKKTNMPIYITEKPEEAVIRGIGKALLEIEKMRFNKINMRKKKTTTRGLWVSP